MSEEMKIRYTGGIGAFFFSAVPGALAGAALLWLTLITGCLDLTKELRQERRMADRVGIQATPLPPVNLIVKNGACLKVDKSFLDGEKLSIYVVNTCPITLGFSQYDVRIVAPDGTVTKSTTDYIPGSESMLAKERREIITTLEADERTAEVHVHVKDGRPGDGL